MAAETMRLSSNSERVSGIKPKLSEQLPGDPGRSRGPEEAGGAGSRWRTRTGSRAGSWAESRAGSSAGSRAGLKAGGISKRAPEIQKIPGLG